MAESPEQEAPDLYRVSVRSDGADLPDTVDLLSITTSKSIGRIPQAQLTVADGDMSRRELPVSDSALFAPGAEIEIRAGYRATEDTIFKGVVIAHGVRLGDAGPTQLVVECRDRAVAMTVDRRSAVYLEMTDGEILSRLIGGYAGLDADVASTRVTWGALVQHYCTDWDFMVTRAEANGRLVIVDDGAVSVAKPDAGPAVLTVTNGVDLFGFEADVDSLSQIVQVQGSSWDPAEQRVMTGRAADPSDITTMGNLSGRQLASVLGVDPYRLQTAAPVPPEALAAWAEGQQVKSALARLRGHLRFQGNTRPKPGTVIELRGVGQRFDGDVFVTGVTHRFDPGRWVTEVAFGLDPASLADRRGLTAVPASGLVPPVDGLQIGVVQQLDRDPGGGNRVKVSVALHGEEADGIWARLAGFSASDATGAFFVPDIGDEVILGFINADPSAPVILGSLYSAKRRPPHPLTAENQTKSLVTRGGLTIDFDDEKKVVTVSTPGGHRLALDDDAGAITFEDSSGNRVTMAQPGITIESATDLTIAAAGQVTVEAGGAIDLTAATDITVEGQDVTNTTETPFIRKRRA